MTASVRIKISRSWPKKISRKNKGLLLPIRSQSRLYLSFSCVLKKKKKIQTMGDEERQRMLKNLYDVKARISTIERLYDEGKMGGDGDAGFKNEHASEGPQKEEEVHLEESTFAFLVATRPWTGPFITGIGVVCLKNTMVRPRNKRLLP